MNGIFGVVAKKNCINDFFYLGDYHSHLSTQFAGFAIADAKKLTRKIHDISYSQFKFKLYDDLKNTKANRAIGAIGYEEQPIYVKSHLGDFCIVVNGWINNWRQLADDLFSRGHSFSEVSDNRVNICELTSKLIIQKDSLAEGIEHMFSRIEGSISLLILTKKGIYAARDHFGMTPLIIGRKKDTWAITTETTAFANLRFETVKYLTPGEVVFISEKGMEREAVKGKNLKICSFLWIYTGFPASSYESINVEIVRERCGRYLAQGDTVTPDLVCGVPDSGTAHALGYAMERGVPYRRPLVKYTPGYGRSYLPPSQEVRDLVATMKLIPIKEIISGKRIVLCEDSIVRGTQLKNFTMQKLWENKAREVHVRVACPPLLFPCCYLFSTRTKRELVARRAIKALEGNDIEQVDAYIDDTSAQYKRMVSWVVKDLGLTSLKYQTLKDMVGAIGLPKDKLCLYCWTGKR